MKQHLIDPEICIRCNTCEESCPIDAVSHGDDNYVVDPAVCACCMDCIAPCPTGAIDHWREVAAPWSVADQLGWTELPPPLPAAEAAPVEALDGEIDALLEEAHSGRGGSACAPASASKPSVNLYNRGRPARATVIGNHRLTAQGTDNAIHHIILDFGTQPFPVLEGQSVGIVPPGVDAEGQPHRQRLYSIASPRDGEKPNVNFMAFTIKRVPDGLCSPYLCDLEKGAQVDVTGPFGATFLMPDDPAAHLLMICTGTGAAPFRAFIKRRYRVAPGGPGRMILFFGARRPEELPYFGPLARLPEPFLDRHICFSRMPAIPKTYVQDALLREWAIVADLLRRDGTHAYLCGLRAMEAGVNGALSDVCSQAGLDWGALKRTMRDSGRLQVETY